MQHTVASLNPEKAKEQKIQQEDMQLRKEKRRRTEPSSYKGGARSSAMSKSYLENDDGAMYDDTDISSIKKNDRGSKGNSALKRPQNKYYDDDDYVEEEEDAEVEDEIEGAVNERQVLLP